MTSLIHTARSVYEALPPAAQEPLGALVRSLPVGMRYGSTFVEAFDEAEWVTGATLEQVERAATRKLRSQLTWAATSPYWAARFAEAGIEPRVAQTGDLAHLEPITKADVREHGGDMVTATDAPRKWVTTGGTTGAPLGLWIDRDASIIDWAYTVSAWSRVGFRLDEPRVVLRGVRLGTGEQRELMHRSALRRELYLSVFDMDRETLPAMRAAVRQSGARFIHGYPSACEVLGKSYRQAGETPPALQAILAVSENLYPGQREYLEELFGTRVFSFYGMTEKVAFAAECEHSTDLHVEPLYGVVELVAPDGSVIDTPGVRGEIVATGLTSASMPLIRYRTGDYASWAEGPCRCGRPHRRLSTIEGRWTQEYLVGAAGERISMTAVNVHSAVFDPVERFRFVQEEPGRAVLEVVPGPGYDAVSAERILHDLRGKLAGHVSLTVRVVPTIAVSTRGKGRFIEQRIGGTA